MEVQKLTRHIGAQISGVDLRKPLTQSQATAILECLYEHQVIFFRDQDITEERQIEFTKELGPMTQTFHNWVHIIENDADIPPYTDEWHTDVSTSEVPPAFAILQALIIPEFGGDTMWVSLKGIWQSLSPTMQSIVRGLRVHHGHREEDTLVLAKRVMPGRSEEQIHKEFSAIHPLVRTHPVTGEHLLFLSERFALSIVDMSKAESNVFLQHLNSLLDDPNFQVRWRWQPNDIAIWDEAATNHRGLSDHYPQHRVMRRTTVAGSAPFLASSDTIKPLKRLATQSATSLS